MVKRCVLRIDQGTATAAEWSSLVLESTRCSLHIDKRRAISCWSLTRNRFGLTCPGLGIFCHTLQLFVYNSWASAHRLRWSTT